MPSSNVQHAELPGDQAQGTAEANRALASTPRGPAQQPSRQMSGIGQLHEDTMAKMTEMAVTVALRLRSMEQGDSPETSGSPSFRGNTHNSANPETPRPPSASTKQMQRSGNPRPASGFNVLPNAVPSVSQTTTPSKGTESLVSASGRSTSRSPSRSHSRAGIAAYDLSPEAAGLQRPSSAGRSGSARRGAGSPGPWDVLPPHRSSSRAPLAARPPSIRDFPEGSRSRGPGAHGGALGSPTASPSRLSKAGGVGPSGVGSRSSSGRHTVDARVGRSWPPGGEEGQDEGPRSLSRSGSRNRSRRNGSGGRMDTPPRSVVSPKSSRAGRGEGGQVGHDEQSPGQVKGVPVTAEVVGSGRSGSPRRMESAESPQSRPPSASKSDRSRKQHSQPQQPKRPQQPPQQQEPSRQQQPPEREQPASRQQQPQQHLEQQEHQQSEAAEDGQEMWHKRVEQPKPQSQQQPQPHRQLPTQDATAAGRSTSVGGVEMQRRSVSGGGAGGKSSAPSGRVERASSLTSRNESPRRPSSAGPPPLTTQGPAPAQPHMNQEPKGSVHVDPSTLRPASAALVDALKKLDAAERRAIQRSPKRIAGKAPPDSAAARPAQAVRQLPTAAAPHPNNLPRLPPMPPQSPQPPPLPAGLDSRMPQPVLESSAPQVSSALLAPQDPTLHLLQAAHLTAPAQPPQPPSPPPPPAPAPAATDPSPDLSRQSSMLTAAALAARLQLLPRSSRAHGPSLSLRDAPAAGAPVIGAPPVVTGSSFSLRPARPPSVPGAAPAPLTSHPELSSRGTHLLHMRPSDNASSGTRPQGAPASLQFTEGPSVSFMAGNGSSSSTDMLTDMTGSTGDDAAGGGRSGVFGKHVGGGGGFGATGGGGLGGGFWEQYPGEVGSHPEMMAAASGTLPLLYGNEWEELTHEVVWRVARAYGFQTFNLNPETRSDPLPQWTPATAFLVSEHLSRILIRNMLTRMKPPSSAFTAYNSHLSGAGAGASVSASVGAASAMYSNNRQANGSVAASGVGSVATATAAAAAAGLHTESVTSGAHSLYSVLSPNAAATAAEATAISAGRPRFAMAVYELHNTIFHVYERRWCPHLELRPRPRDLQRILELSRWTDTAALNGLLSELALYFLLYSEAVNLRHTPEMLWFLFWAAVHSPAMEMRWREGLPEVKGENQGAWGRRIKLRTQFQRDIASLQAQVGAPPGSRPQPPPPPAQQLPAAVPPDLAAAALLAFAAAAMEALVASAASSSPPGRRLAATLSPNDVNILADLAAYGDGGFVMDRIVTPLFYFLSHEMDALFEAGVEVAHRLGYDDVNESMCRRDVVDRLLVTLGVTEEALAFGEVLDVWRALTELGCTFPEETDGSGQVHPAPQTFDAQVVANFWSAEVFVKTFRERRSWAAVFRAFFRVYCLQLVIAHLVMAAAFAPGDRGALSSAVLTHAWLSALERMANWWLSRNPRDPLLLRQRDSERAEAQVGGAEAAAGSKRGIGSRTFRSQTGLAASQLGAEASMRAGARSIAGSEAAAAAAAEAATGADPSAAALPVETPAEARTQRRLVRMEGQPRLGGLVGCLDWVAAAAALTGLYMTYLEDPGGDGFLHQAHVHLQHWWLPGTAVYASTVVFTGVITTRPGYRLSVLAICPPLRRLLACHSAMPPAECWLEGWLGVDWKAWAVNLLMWAVIMALKVAFEYYAIAKPMVAPIRALLQRKWPGCSSWPCTHASWGLAALRLLPLVLVCLADTTIIYNVAMAAFGILRGLLRLDLGTVATWEDLRAAFHRGPVRWWRRCMSSEGVSSHRRGLRRQLMEGGQDRAGAEAFVPETPAPQNVDSSDEDDDDGDGEADDGGADGGDGAADDGDDIPAGEEDDVFGSDEERRGSAASRGRSGGRGPLGGLWPLRTTGRESRWARDARRGLGKRIRQNGGASAMTVMQVQDLDNNSMLHAAGRWATAPVSAPLGSAILGVGRRRDMGSSGTLSSRAGGGSMGGAPWSSRRRGSTLNRAPTPAGGTPQRGRRRFSDSGAARAVAEGLELAVRGAAASVRRVAGGPGAAIAAATAGRHTNGAARGGWGVSSGGGAFRRSLSSGSDDEVERRAAEVSAPVVRTPIKAPDVSGLWQRLHRRSNPSGDVVQILGGRPGSASAGGSGASGASGGGSGGGGGGGSAGGAGPSPGPGARSWGLLARHNAVAPLPPMPLSPQHLTTLSPASELMAALGSPGGSPRATLRAVSVGEAIAPGAFGISGFAPAPAAAGLEGLVTPRRIAFAAGPVHCSAGPVAEASLGGFTGSSSSVGITRLPRREPSTPAVHSLGAASSPPALSRQGSRRVNASSDASGRQRDQDYWQRRQRQLSAATAATPAPSSLVTQQLPSQSTPATLQRPTTFLTQSLGSLSEISTDQADRLEGEGEELLSDPTGPADRGLRRAGAETTERDRVVALHRTEDLSLGVLLSRQNGDLAMWDAFATVWDGIVDDLRAQDLISDQEASNLRFMRLGHFQGRHALRPILLPAFFYAGQVQAFVDTGRLGGVGSGGATTTILTELRSLLMWLACELGLLSEVQAEAILGMSFLHFTTDVDHANCRAKMLLAGQSLVKQLSELCTAAVAQHKKRHQQRQQHQQPGYRTTLDDGSGGGPAQKTVPGGKASPQQQRPHLAKDGSPKQPSDGAKVKRLDRAASQRGAAADAAAKALVAAHAGGIVSSLREVLDALAGEARAVRRAVSFGRVSHDVLSGAVKLEEVAQQVLTDLSAHPDFLPSCLTHLLPRTVIHPAPVAELDDALDSPPPSSGCPAPATGSPASVSKVQTPPPVPYTFSPGGTPLEPLVQANGGSPVSGRPMQPPGVTSGSPLRNRPLVPLGTKSPSRASPLAGAPASVTSDVIDHGSPYAPRKHSAHDGDFGPFHTPPPLIRVRASEEFLADSRPVGHQNGSSWGSGVGTPAGPPPLEPEVALRVRVVEVLVKMLTTPASACRPAGAEAIRILGFFINSLSNPQLKKPPPLSDMLSWSVLTPCYEEDVLYPLSADLAAKQLGLPPPPPVGPGRPPDLLSETEDNVSLMAYLRSVFPADWKNFLERLSGMLGGADLSRITENDFGPMGPLHALAPELQLWATYRGQLLGRTVRGMMCYRRAVRMLVELEHPRPAGLSPAAYSAWAEAVVDSKFQYVCTCQVYGKNRKATDIRRRWLAEGVDSLCLEFPALRVAYLDTAATSYGPTDYSVLLRGNPHHPAALAGAARGVASAAAASASEGGALAAGAIVPPAVPAASQAPTQLRPPRLSLSSQDSLQRLAPPRSLFAPRPPSTRDEGRCKDSKEDGQETGGDDSGQGTDGISSFKSDGCTTTAYITTIGNGGGGSGGDGDACGGGDGGGCAASSTSSFSEPPDAAAVANVFANSDSPTLELYRVRLPHNRYGKRGVILGEGKPENQNHATIFCFGEALQTIDMNQDNTLAEALKMRNLLRELAPEPAPRRLVALAAHPRSSTSAEQHRRALAARTGREVPVALVGFREWIFSDVSGALGTFAAACELAFGTIVQRTMSYPGRVRFHYGHPDVFNKMHIMTRGGVSKATRQLHISEDVFGGFNQMLRGGQIKYKEYISCGKGRDMGFDSINAFEIKISGGGGECVVSRDVARLAPRMDLARLMHFYHSGPGYYINSLFIMTAVWLNIWVIAVFALARASSVQIIGEDGSMKLEDTLRVEQALSLGPLMLLPYAAQLLLEWGFLRTVATLAVQIIAGSVAFAVFRQQTTAYYFKDDITYGGARYISTGRGFSITSSSFTTLFTNYARSHLYPGMELLHLLILYAAVRDCPGCSYAAVTWGTWLVAVALLLSPFWFNPMAFEREKVSRDWSAWKGWMRGEVDTAAGNNWHTWNRKQLEKVRNERGTVTDAWLNVVVRLLEEVAPRLVLVVAAVSRLDLRIDQGPRALSSPLVSFTTATAFLWLVVLLSWGLQRHFAERGRGRAWRLYRVLMSVFVAAVLLGYSVAAVRFFRGPRLPNLALLLYANSQLVLAVHRALEQLAPASSFARALVDGGYWLIDWGVGTLLLCLVTLLAWLGFVSKLQTRLLFNSSFAESIQRGKLVRTIGLMKLDEEHRWRNEGQARAALAKSVAMSFRKSTTMTAGVHHSGAPGSGAAHQAGQRRQQQQ